jgi:hypothetical protein
MNKGILFAALLALPLQFALADDFADATKALCEKVKKCTLQSMGEENIPPGMRDMITQSMDSACADMQQQFNPAMRQHELYKPAMACMRSMAALSCDTLMNDDNETRECKEYEKRRKAYED